MKNNKLYNVIFPIWMLYFFPPVIFIALAGNFLIDSIVLIITFYLFSLSNSDFTLKKYYKSHIVKVWLFGFLADIIGAVLLLIINSLENVLYIPHDIINAVSYNPFSHIVAFFIVLLAMVVSGFFIFIFNYTYTFKQVTAEGQRFKIALTIAIITIPWTFLLPLKWFY